LARRPSRERLEIKDQELKFRRQIPVGLFAGI
jgi:hypothetical protein